MDSGSGMLLCLIGFFAGTHEFSFQYENFFFNETHANIAWTTPTSCDGNISYSIVKASRGDIDSNQQMCNVNKNLAALGNTSLQDDFNNVFKIYINACCDAMETVSNSIQIPAEVKTEVRAIKPNVDLCLNPNSLAITVIWPTDKGGNCACSRWYQIDRCSCVVMNNIRNVYNIRNSREDMQICWRNVTNHTRIHLVVESQNPTALLNPIPFPLVNQEFIQSYDLVIAETPSPPRIETIVANAEGRLQLCLLDIYNGQSPIIYYLIKIRDVTSFQSSYTINKTKSGCHNIPISQPDYTEDCRPLTVFVQSYNLIGFSEVGNRTIDKDDSANECECFKRNVQVNVEQIVNVTSATLLRVEIKCTTNYDSLEMLNMQIDLENSFKTINMYMVQCDRILDMTGLEGSTTYQLDIKWLKSQGTMCKINDNPFMLSTISNANNTTYNFVFLIFLCFVLLFI